MPSQLANRRHLDYKSDNIYVFQDGLYQFFTFTLFPGKGKPIFRIRIDKDAEEFAKEQRLNYYKFEFASSVDVNYWIKQNRDKPILDVWSAADLWHVDPKEGEREV